MKKILGVSLLFALTLNLTNAQSAEVNVVINEVAWAGTAASSADEWIELYNPTNQNIDLSGWSIDDDDGSQTYLLSGLIGPYSYFLIEDSEESTSIPGDVISNLSLTNTGDKLVLKNSSGNAVDTVNAASSAWYGGSGEDKSTMERVSSSSEDSSTNWSSNTGSNGALDRNGNIVAGTPRSQNSASAQRATFRLVARDVTPAQGETLTIEAKTENAIDLFSYGMDISYDPAVLRFVDATERGFLSDNSEVMTTFQFGLENEDPGKIIVAGARLLESPAGIPGSGDLFFLNFDVIGNGGSVTDIAVGTSSFLANSGNDLITDFSGIDNITVNITVTNPAQELAAVEGPGRYQIALDWDSSPDAQYYKVMRKNPAGNYMEIGSTTTLNWTDGSSSQLGGKIIPEIDYEYRVIAVRNGVESAGIDVTQKDTRGLKGDTNRSDRIDGRDLERLAKHFAETLEDSQFEALIDTTYDGRVDGSDLIDIGVNWALVYETA